MSSVGVWQADAQAGPDGELVRRVLGGERGAFEGLVRRHQDRLYRHALGMVGDPDVAADLVQDSLIRGYTHIDRCNDPDAFGGWVFRILRNRTLDYLKNPRRSEQSLDSSALSARSPSDPHRRAEATDIGEAIEQALDRLPVDQKEAFLMKHVEDRSYEEMSELLDASVSALKMRVKRAREALQVVLEQYESAGL